MIEKKIVAAIAAYDKRVHQEEAARRINIITRRRLNDEMLVLMFEYICDLNPDLSGRSSAIVVDNKVYVNEDWDECPFTDEEVNKNTWIEAIEGNVMIVLDGHLPENLKVLSRDLTAEEEHALRQSDKLWFYSSLNKFPFYQNIAYIYAINLRS